MPPRVSRPAWLWLTLLLVTALAAGCDLGGGGDENAKAGGTASKTAATFQQFRSRPDLRPPKIVVAKAPRQTATGLIFISPKKEGSPGGPLILDGKGRVVWFHSVQPRQSTDFRVQRYRGRLVLTWWEGTQPVIGVGSGSFVIMDESYRRIARIEAGNGLDGDLHEFLITPRNTALIAAYELVRRDLSAFGGPKSGHVFDSVVQELEIPTARVLFEWRSLDHVPLAESAQRAPARTASAKAPFDYFHVNSVEVDTDSNLILSARNTNAVYKIDRRTGKVLWRLGGRNSDFALGPGAKFAWQHDARRQADGTIRLFDNSASPKVAEQSRAIVLRLDQRAKVASLVRAYAHPDKLLSPHQGNAQQLANGGVFVGWGGKPNFTEFDADGRVVFDAHLAAGDSYRAYRLAWSGRPVDRPAVATRAATDGRITLYASWNGATEVASWEVLAGPDSAHLSSLATAPKAGFETAVAVRTRQPFLSVRARDSAGRTLGTSPSVEAPGRS